MSESETGSLEFDNHKYFRKAVKILVLLTFNETILITSDSNRYEIEDKLSL